MSLTNFDQAQRDLERYFHVVLPDALGNPALGFRDGTWFRLTAGMRPQPLMSRSAILEHPAQAGSIVQIICWWMRENHGHPRALDLATELAITVAELARGGRLPARTPRELTGPSPLDPSVPAPTSSWGRPHPQPEGLGREVPGEGYPDWRTQGQQMTQQQAALPPPHQPVPMQPRAPIPFSDGVSGGQPLPGQPLPGEELTGPWRPGQAAGAPPMPPPMPSGGYPMPDGRYGPDLAAIPPYTPTPQPARPW